MNPTPHHVAVDSLLERACELAAVVRRLTDRDINELQAAVLERIGRGVELQGFSRDLRPVLNQVLDVLDRSELDAAQVATLTRIVFS